MTQQTKYWTNPSVIALAGDSDPLGFITELARGVVLNAIQEGWQGPPFDPFKLAEYLRITTVPREDVHDARIVPVGTKGIRIEFNPTRPRGRMRFSVAHEVAHTLFPDCTETVRNRARTDKIQKDDWQLELLCNIAAAEFLMPIGTAIDIENEPVNIDNLLRLQKQYDVSTEAISHRLVKLTSEPCAMFAAARILDDEEVTPYRVDYTIPSRSCNVNIPQGLQIQGKTILSECTAVGFTAKGRERLAPQLPELDLECVGIPPYPHHYFPRVVGIAYFTRSLEKTSPLRIRYLRGDATEPRGTGWRIIAQIVNDKTPNWGGGFAKYVKQKWPPVQRDFREWALLSRDNLSLGNFHLSKISNDLSIMHMIAQHGYGPSTKPRIRYAALKACLDELAETALKHRATVHMPRIGSGQAGGNWGIIQELIDEALVLHGIDVTVYDLPSSELEVDKQGLLKLKMERQ